MRIVLNNNINNNLDVYFQRKVNEKRIRFSKGERGKFYRSDAELYLPIYIEPDMMEVLRNFSKKKGVDVATIVNEWIKKDISIIETITK